MLFLLSKNINSLKPSKSFKNFCVENTRLSGFVMQLAEKSSAEISKPMKYFVAGIVPFIKYPSGMSLFHFINLCLRKYYLALTTKEPGLIQRLSFPLNLFLDLIGSLGILLNPFFM